MSLRRPAFLSCSDCTVTSWSFQTPAGTSSTRSTPTAADAVIEFCSVHRANFRAPSVTDSSTPPPASVPGVQMRIPTANRAPLSLQTSDSSAATLPITSQRPVNSSLSCNIDAIVEYYNKCNEIVLAEGISKAKACEQLGRGYDKRTFRRRQPIAELKIICPEEYDKIVDILSRAAGGRYRSISQESLSRECARIMSTSVMIAKKRISVTRGQLMK